MINKLSLKLNIIDSEDKQYQLIESNRTFD